MIITRILGCLFFALTLLTATPITNARNISVNDGEFESTERDSTTRPATDDELEQEIAILMKRAQDQRRSSLTYNSILSHIARERAYDMAQRNYFAHVNPDGIGANYLVTRAGYVLPDFYGKEVSANNIESIACGNETAAATWTQWMHSSGHREHILGLTDFYAAQTDYGVGHAFVPGSRWKHYWVVITAKPGEDIESPASSRDAATDSTSNSCNGSETEYPHVVRKANGNLMPASGYEWVTDQRNDYRVRLMRGLVETSNGKLRPAAGYRWVHPDDPEDLRVERVP